MTAILTTCVTVRDTVTTYDAPLLLRNNRQIFIQMGRGYSISKTETLPKTLEFSKALRSLLRVLSSDVLRTRMCLSITGSHRRAEYA